MNLQNFNLIESSLGVCAIKSDKSEIVIFISHENHMKQTLFLEIQEFNTQLKLYTKNWNYSFQPISNNIVLTHIPTCRFTNYSNLIFAFH